jgi:hypothetical protein
MGKSWIIFLPLIASVYRPIIMVYTDSTQSPVYKQWSVISGDKKCSQENTYHERVARCRAVYLVLCQSGRWPRCAGRQQLDDSGTESWTLWPHCGRHPPTTRQGPRAPAENRNPILQFLNLAKDLLLLLKCRTIFSWPNNLSSAGFTQQMTKSHPKPKWLQLFRIPPSFGGVTERRAPLVPRIQGSTSGLAISKIYFSSPYSPLAQSGL